ncbi:MAG: ATPase, partial [Desulfuromonadales bacterium]|nr:ATPase [Desulfuromonadales bacterium]
IERLEALVGELLNFASLPQPRLRPGNLGEVLRDTLSLVRRQCHKSGVYLEE